MLEEIRTKVRALTEDFSTKGFETFEYTNSNIWTIAESNITITAVLVNGNPLESGETYSYDSSTGKITITRASWSTTDQIEVDYTYYKYSDSELDEYVRGALVWISTFDENSDFELESEEIYPTPDNQTIDLIALITSILIKPDFAEKRLPNLTVRYNEKQTKEKLIKETIMRFRSGMGITDILTWD